jgi:cytochrome b561
MTTLHQPSDRYHHLSIFLHWILALALLGAFALGLYMADLPLSPQRIKLFNWHKWAGVLILALSLVRLLARLTLTAPPLPASIAQAMPRWQQQAHQATHLGLYALFFAVPLLGWAYSSAAGFPIVLWGVLPLPDWVGADKALAELLKPWHQLSAYAMAALVLVHIAGAVKHQWIDRDRLIDRMLPSHT